MTAVSPHIPVLYQEALEGLALRGGGRYIDATLGGGGHAEGMLAGSSPAGLLLGVDLDPEAVAIARTRLAQFGDRARLVEGDFRDLSRIAADQGFDPCDGVLLDLGMSSAQLVQSDRGFSYREAGPLDMRFSPRLETTASDLVNQLAEPELAKIFHRYGEEPKARAIARAVVRQRPVETTDRLARIVAGVLGRRRRHPARRVFQALRIAVNDELGALEAVLPQAVSLLRAGGRLAVIAFHSLEDRIVKRFMKREAQDCICERELPVCICQHRASVRILTRRPVRAGPDEVAQNPRARSGRLRVAARLPDPTSVA